MQNSIKKDFLRCLALLPLLLTILFIAYICFDIYESDKDTDEILLIQKALFLEQTKDTTDVDVLVVRNLVKSELSKQLKQTTSNKGFIDD